MPKPKNVTAAVRRRQAAVKSRYKVSNGEHHPLASRELGVLADRIYPTTQTHKRGIVHFT